MMQMEKWIDEHREDIIASTQALLRIKSVKEEGSEGQPFGKGIADSLAFVLDKGREMGFITRNLDGYAGYAEFGDGDETLGILVHLDLVPEGTGWTYPPYGAEIHDGRIYARGAIDNKGPAMAALYGMKAVMESRTPLSKKVRIIFGCDEESDWEDMAYYQTKEKMPDLGFSPDAEFPVINTEKGILHIRLGKSLPKQGSKAFQIEEIQGGTRPNVVPDEAACILSHIHDVDALQNALEQMKKEKDWRMEMQMLGNDRAVIRSFGISAHGSTPEKGQNAIGQLLLFLSSMVAGEGEREKCIEFLARRIGLEHDGASLGVAMEDVVSGKLTLNLGILQLIDDELKVVLDIRYPVSYHQDQILQSIQKKTSDMGFVIEVLSSQAPLHIPEDHFLVRKLKDVYTQLTGQEAYTIAIGGGTYARALKNAVAFGPQFPGKPELAHQKDEYIEIDDLLLSAKIYARAIYELAR